MIEMSMSQNIHKTSREFYLNADFDLTLRGAASLLDSPDANFVHEMAWHYFFAADSNDSVILHRPLPTDFLSYIQAQGLALPKLILHPEFSSTSLYTPFGWNPAALDRLNLYQNPPDYPGLDIVKRVNSRAFSRNLEKVWDREEEVSDSQAELGGQFTAYPELDKFLCETSRTQGWMVKGDHGHAGTANCRVLDGNPDPEIQKYLLQILSEHHRVIVEPFHDRILDMSANFMVEKDGSVAEFRGHELFNSRDGAFLGVKINPDRQPPAPWGEALKLAAKRLGQALRIEGYFGPVSMDAYVYQDKGEPKLRPLVDLNARHSMALPIHGLARRLPGKFLLWTWTKPKKLTLPISYTELQDRFGSWAFDPLTQSGILAVSPVWRESEKAGTKIKAVDRAKAKRLGFLFCADGEEALALMRQAFATAMGRR